MNRRSLLKLLSLGAVSHTLDLDKLLWVPGEKTIFLPPIHRLTESDIISIELARILPTIKNLFNREDMFYRSLVNDKRSPCEDRRQILDFRIADRTKQG
jgi:hypothetical protein